jgi:AcrR family transcriptional regulator
VVAKGTEKIQDTAKYEAIVEAACTLFAEKGYEDTTIADIARSAGIAVGTVYLYFHNKHEIYTAVACNVEALMADAFQNPELLLLPFEQRVGNRAA